MGGGVEFGLIVPVFILSIPSTRGSGGKYFFLIHQIAFLGTSFSLVNCMIEKLIRSLLSLIPFILSFYQGGPLINEFGPLSPLENSLPNLSFLLYQILLIPNHPSHTKKIWKLAISPRVKAFSWTTVLGRINMMDMLQRRKPFMPLSPHWCALCQMDGKSVHHIFLHCSFTHKVWIHFISRIGVYWVMPETIQLMFFSWKYFGDSLRSTKFGECLLHAILWGIWRERNDIIFLGKARNCEEVIEAIIRELGCWLKASPNFKDILLADFLRDWVTTISCLSFQSKSPCISSWREPSNEILKLNFDGASKGNPGPAGFGCVICDHNGNISLVLSGLLEYCNSTRAETMGMLMGIRELKKLGASGAIIEGDSAVVIGWGNGKVCNSWELWNLVYEITKIASDIGCSFSLIP